MKNLNNILILFAFVLVGCSSLKEQYQKTDNYKTIFNKQGNKLQVDEYNLDGEVRYTTKQKYNQKGQKIEEIGFDSEMVFEKNIFKYNEKGCLEEVYFYNPEELEMKCVFEYEVENKKVKTTFYGLSKLDDKKDFIFQCVEKYDKKENRIEVVKYEPNNIIFKILFEYNQNGDKILEKVYTSNEELENTFSYKYEKYDTKGNWIKQVMYKNDKPIEIIERRFEYFK